MSSSDLRERALDAERARRADLLPPGAACEACGEDDPLLLDGDAALVLCADDAAIDRGRELVDEHHLAGRRWDIVLDLTPNWHRVVTALQRLEGEVTHGNMAEVLYGMAYLNIAVADHVARIEKKGAKPRVGRARSASRSDRA
jgi:hypothetical protein